MLGGVQQENRVLRWPAEGQDSAASFARDTIAGANCLRSGKMLTQQSTSNIQFANNISYNGVSWDWDIHQ